jgi:hypothetical protein
MYRGVLISSFIDSVQIGEKVPLTWSFLDKK